MDNKVKFYIINEEGIREEAQILAKYKLSNNNNYITYTYGEINDNQMIKIYSTGVVLENGIYSYKEIQTNDEWNEIKDVMKTLARDINEKIPENLKCDLKFSNEEVSVRRPKKLLVSKKFADTLASKYEETKEEPVMVNKINNLNVEPAVNTPADFILNQSQTNEKDDILNKTIEIPTFEELQARNKHVDNVMFNSKPDVSTNMNPVNNIVSEEKQDVIENIEVGSDSTQKYKEKFKKEVEPLLLNVYTKQQQQIEALEEELSKTKFDLFEKQKETLSLKKEKDELVEKGSQLEEQLNGVQQKMNGIINVLQGDTTTTNTNKTISNEFEEERI